MDECKALVLIQPLRYFLYVWNEKKNFCMPFESYLGLVLKDTDILIKIIPQCDGWTTKEDCLRYGEFMINSYPFINTLFRNDTLLMLAHGRFNTVSGSFDIENGETLDLYKKESNDILSTG